MKFGIGQPVRRVEDARLVTGRGKYVDDLVLPNMAHAYVVRSPHAHARIVEIDTAEAKKYPGVLAVLTGSDFVASGLGMLPSQLSELAAVRMTHGSSPFVPPNPVLAVDRVRCVGDPVVVVVAETLAGAKDGGEVVSIAYEELPCVLDAANALQEGSPLVWSGAGSNVSVDAEYGDSAAVERAFANAHKTVEIQLRNNRIAVMSMEPRGAVGHFEASPDRLTLYAGLQGVARPRAVLANDIFKLPMERVRVVSHDVGGGFGMKSALYPEYVLVLWASRQLGRPVKWISERTEAFVSDSQGRDNITSAALALDSNGRFLALRVDTIANLGAYPGLMNPVVPHVIGPATAMGVYATPVVHHRVRSVFTNSVFVGPYRGAGRPEAAYLVERLADLAGHATGLGPIEIRRRNFISCSSMPWTTPIGTVYDSGDFGTVFERALEVSDYQGFAARRVSSKAKGRLRGFGFSTYIESAGGRPSDWGSLRVHPDGRNVLRIGTHSHGQGHETTFAQVVAEMLQVSFESIAVEYADSDDLTSGSGTHASRSMRVAGTVVAATSREIIDRGARIARHLLGGEHQEIRYEEGIFRPTHGNRTFSLYEIAAAAENNAELPVELQGPLSAVHDYRSTGLTFPNGCHVCEVEIDRDTGEVEVVAYSCVDDVGRVINPMIVEGQVHGGIAQGLGQALMEQCVYDAGGQLVTGSLMDYAIPRASQMPGIETRFHQAHTRNNPLGIKGAGEGGATAAPPAIVNAVVDALREFGITHVDMPLTSERIWQLMRQ
jgi:aerobic carbon-monoxide dehydrogenase large subunit